MPREKIRLEQIRRFDRLAIHEFGVEKRIFGCANRCHVKAEVPAGLTDRSGLYPAICGDNDGHSCVERNHRRRLRFLRIVGFNDSCFLIALGR